MGGRCSSESGWGIALPFRLSGQKAACGLLVASIFLCWNCSDTRESPKQERPVRSSEDVAGQLPVYIANPEVRDLALPARFSGPLPVTDEQLADWESFEDPFGIQHQLCQTQPSATKRLLVALRTRSGNDDAPLALAYYWLVRSCDGPKYCDWLTSTLDGDEGDAVKSFLLQRSYYCLEHQSHTHAAEDNEPPDLAQSPSAAAPANLSPSGLAKQLVDWKLLPASAQTAEDLLLEDLMLAHGRAHRIDTEMDFDIALFGKHHALLGRLAAIASPDLDGARFSQIEGNDEDSQPILLAYLKGKEYSLKTQRKLFDLEAVVGLLNRLLVEQGSTKRLVLVPAADRQELVIVGPTAGLQAAQAAGLVEFVQPL